MLFLLLVLSSCRHDFDDQKRLNQLADIPDGIAADSFKESLPDFRITVSEEISESLSLDFGNLDGRSDSRVDDLTFLTMDANTSASYAAKPTVLVGGYQTEIRRRFAITNVSGHRVRVVAVQTSCGCSNVEIDQPLIAASSHTELAVSVKLNPTTSQSEKDISVGVIFENRAALYIQFKVHSVPSVCFSSFWGTEKNALDGGTIRFDLNDTTIEKKYYRTSQSLEYYATERSELDSNFFVDITAVNPEQLSLSVERVGEVMTKKIADEVVYFRRVDIGLALPADFSLPAFSTFTVAGASGSKFVVSLTLDFAEQLMCQPKSLVFRGREAPRRFSIERTDSLDLGDLNISFDDQVLNVFEVGRNQNRVDFEVVVTKWPKKLIEKHEISCSTADGLTAGPRVIIISPNEGEIK